MKYQHRKLALACVAVVANAAVASAAFGQDYPTRSVRVVVPISPGGGMDLTARGVAQRMNEVLGQSMVIDNRPGGGGSIGAELAKAAPPDGYNLLVASGTLVTHKLLSGARYDTVKDFSPVTQLSRQPYVLIVNPSVPATTMPEFIAYAKANPGRLNYPSSGNGSLINLTGELFASLAGVKLVHVPYKGMAGSYPDLLAGQIQISFASVISATPHIKSGKLRALGVTTRRRAVSMPELPSISDYGLPSFDVAQWYGMFAPAGTPRPIIDRLYRATAKALVNPELIARMASDGSEPVGSTPEEFAAHVKAEIARWGAIIEQAGIKGE